MYILSLGRLVTASLLVFLQLTVPEVRSQGLFPPVAFSSNFATLSPVETTSTCDVCNASCPYGDELPSGVDLFQGSQLAGGVVGLCNTIRCSA